MSLFKRSRPGPAPKPHPQPQPTNPVQGGDTAIPVALLDLTKRYDIHLSCPGEVRLYEQVRIVGIRTFEQKDRKFSTPLIGGYLELEAPDGARLMIPPLRISMICEHGAQPKYRSWPIAHPEP